MVNIYHNRMPQLQTLLGRAPHRIDPGQPVLGDIALARGRVHEAFGPARHSFAALAMRAMEGPVFWLAPMWERAGMHGPGLMQMGVDPGRITFARARHPMDLLWSLEEVLRAGVVPLVVADLPAPPGLTPMRRLQLAAEAGAARGYRPLGLILTPEGGAAGAESRWQIIPEHRPGTQAWRVTRTRARMAAPRTWRVTRTAATTATGVMDAGVTEAGVMAAGATEAGFAVEPVAGAEGTPVGTGRATPAQADGREDERGDGRTDGRGDGRAGAAGTAARAG